MNVNCNCISLEIHLYEGGHYACGSCWIVKLTASALKLCQFSNLKLNCTYVFLEYVTNSMICPILSKSINVHSIVKLTIILRYQNDATPFGFGKEAHKQPFNNVQCCFNKIEVDFHCAVATLVSLDQVHSKT
ncbi:hypothetical protein AHAS_Ahas13G0177300 [Arachis hypogaea]